MVRKKIVAFFKNPTVRKAVFWLVPLVVSWAFKRMDETTTKKK
ncbi:MAG: hypothetical protein ACM3MA_01940 [Acidobacteriota bacterium]|jgi:hypothetical protein